MLKTVSLFAGRKRKGIYLVGGFLRDMFLKRENHDIDFCLREGAINFGRQLAKETGCGYVVLDKEHGCCRLVKKTENSIYTLDFTDFRAPTLNDDLLHRDFTINAMAVKFEAQAFTGPLDKLIIDPFHGRRDLKLKLIRLVSPEAFDEDPLRILRAFSLACRFGFQIDKNTLGLIKLKTEKLSEVSVERVRDELFKVLDTPCAWASLKEMDKLKILKVILPEVEVMRGVRQGPYHHLDVWRHSLETVHQLENLFQETRRSKDIQAHCDEFMSSGRRRRSLIKLGCLLHDIGKPKALRRKGGKTIFHGHERIGRDYSVNIARRLKLSNDELVALGKMVMWHLRPGYLADNQEVTPRAKFRYFRDAAEEGVSTLLLSMADQRSTCGPLTTQESKVRHEKVCLGLIREYFRRKKAKKIPPLINGDDLIKSFQLSPSPLIGKILREAQELQAIGKINNKKEALAMAKGMIKHS